MRLVPLSVLIGACATTPARHPTAMEAIPPPVDEQPKAPEVDANLVVLGVGETVERPAGDVKSWSESGPGIVEVTSNGSTIAVRGNRPGTNIVVYVLADGRTESIEYRVMQR